MCLFYLNVLYFVIPVLDTEIQHFHTISSSTLFLHNAFILTNLVKSWIPVSEHWDDILLVLKPQHCHVSRAGMTAKSKLLASIMICNRSKAIVLLNLGGPDSPNMIRPFLFNLFYDRRIINLPNPFRFLLAKFISAKRKNTAQKIYEQIGGKSPILENTKMQAEALERELNRSVFCHPSSVELGSRKKNWLHAGITLELAKVFVCMRYWHPFADEVVKSVKQFGPDEVILLPLYPQYSTTTTLSSIENWQKNAKRYDLKCNTKIINHYYDNQDFIEAHVSLTAQYYKLASKISKPRILFSAHSLPLSIIEKGDPYASQIEETVKLIVKKLNIKDLDWSICYQSKIGPVKWLEPSTESELLRAKADGVPVVLSPISFVSEHSETLVELDIEYKAMIKDGYYFRVPTLSTNSLFIKCLADLCRNCP